MGICSGRPVCSVQPTPSPPTLDEVMDRLIGKEGVVCRRQRSRRVDTITTELLPPPEQTSGGEEDQYE